MGEVGISFGGLYFATARHRRRKSFGFTLVELLVVMGIITVLIAILLPAISHAWAQSRFIACKANLRTIVQAHLLYSQSNRDIKPPQWQQTAVTVQYDYVCPDLKWNGLPVGQGLLVTGGYLTINSLMDPSEGMTDDTARDLSLWADPTAMTSGCSYAYFSRVPPAVPVGTIINLTTIGRMTYQICRNSNETAIAMDLNAQQGHQYIGEYQNLPWVSHPLEKRMNVAYLDGSVLDFGLNEVQLQYPGGSFQELQWVNEANVKKQ